MKIEWSEKTPRKIQQFPNPDYPSENPELEDVLTSSDVDHVAQIFQTPLTGSYNWDYSVQDDRIKKLYELGKQLNWDPQMNINWDQPWPEEEGQAELMNLHDYPPYLALSNKERDEFWLHMNAWSLSQFLHGEQGPCWLRVSSVPARQPSMRSCMRHLKRLMRRGTLRSSINTSKSALD